MAALDVEIRLEKWIRDAFQVRTDDASFDRDVDLFEAGYVDSLGLAELLAFIEREFGVRVPDTDLLSDGFSSIHGMGRVIERLFTGEQADPWRADDAAGVSRSRWHA